MNCGAKMTTIEQEEKRFDELCGKFQDFFWAASPYLKIEESKERDGYIASAYLSEGRDKIVIQRSSNPDDEDAQKSITLAMKALNDRLEARLNGKVE